MGLQRMAAVIAHEIAHQWLRSGHHEMVDDIWLNEGRLDGKQRRRSLKPDGIWNWMTCRE